MQSESIDKQNVEELAINEFNGFRETLKERICDHLDSIEQGSDAWLFTLYDPGNADPSVSAGGFNVSDNVLVMRLAEFLGAQFGKDIIPQVEHAIRKSAEMNRRGKYEQ